MLDKRSVPQRIIDVLEGAGAPLFLGEIYTALDEQYPREYLSATLTGLIKSSRVEFQILDKQGFGRRQAKAYFLKQIS